MTIKLVEDIPTVWILDGQGVDSAEDRRNKKGILSGVTRGWQMRNCLFDLEISPLQFLLVRFCPLKFYFFRILYLFLKQIVIVMLQTEALKIDYNTFKPGLRSESNVYSIKNPQFIFLSFLGYQYFVGPKSFGLSIKTLPIIFF